MNPQLDEHAAELSRRLVVAMDAGNVPEALEMMARLRPLYLSALNEAINGKARRNDPGGSGAVESDSLASELEEYRRGAFD